MIFPVFALARKEQLRDTAMPTLMLKVLKAGSFRNFCFAEDEYNPTVR